MFLPLLLGGLICIFVLVPFFDKRSWRLVSLGKLTKGPENRLNATFVGGPCFVISLFWFGWTSREDISAAVPAAAGVLFGVGYLAVFYAFSICESILIVVSNSSTDEELIRSRRDVPRVLCVSPITSYSPILTDSLYRSALGANQVLRSILATIFPLFARQRTFLSPTLPLPFLLSFRGSYKRNRGRLGKHPLRWDRTHPPPFPLGLPALRSETESSFSLFARGGVK